MTEEEAKHKICPMPEMGNCVASYCMLWRWDLSPSQAAETNARGNACAVPDGRCGLAK